MRPTRTVNSLRNTIVAFAIYLVNLTLQFVSRKIFIDYLGADILGLNTTITSMLQFLNIAELGISSAVAYTLYEPIKLGNSEKINEIISLQGYLYKRIGYFILISGLLLMLFFHLVFAKITLPIWYVYTTYLVFLFSSLLTYFFTYKQIILSASQQEYKIQLSYKLSHLIKVFVQIIVVKHLEHAYVWWLLIEGLFALISCISVNIVVKKSFPLLVQSKSTLRELNRKYPTIKKKVFQLFFHKIASFALTQISPIILYAYASLLMVTKYQNYTMITLGITSMLSALFNGLNASVGNLVAEDNLKRILSVFRELFSSRFLIVSSCTICFFYLCNPFISLWIGENYILSVNIVLLLSIIFFITTMRSVVDSYIQAYGLFSDIWAPITEALLNIGLSIILGKYLGLSGILLGVLVSLLLIIVIWKPIMLFRKGFHHSIKVYIKMYMVHLLILGATIPVIKYAASFLDVYYCTTFIDFAYKRMMKFIPNIISKKPQR